MKKALLSTFLILALLALALSLSACTPTPPEDTEFDYTVSIVDGAGAPVKDIVYRVMLGEEEVAFGLTNSTGSFSGTVANGSYKVTLESPFGKEFFYDTNTATFSKDAPNLTISIYDTLDKSMTENLFLQSGGDSRTAIAFRDGAFRVELKAGINYFVFVPTVRGKYEISAIGDSTVSLGYYGGPYFVQTEDILKNGEIGGVKKNDGKLYFDIRTQNIGEDYSSTSKYVIGITASADTAVYLSAKKVEDLELSIEEMPWNEIILGNDPPPYNVPYGTSENINLVDFDITDESLTIVYNSEDGYYHLGTADGPLMLLRVSTPNAYLDENFTFKNLCENTYFACYIYNEDGSFKSKTSYHEMMLKYIEAADTKYGVVPLDKNLEEAIRNYGAYNKWFELATTFNLFGDLASRVVEENAWLFATCYVDGYTSGNSDNPYTMKSEATVILDGTGEVYLKNNASVALSFTVTNTNGSVKITTDNGVISDATLDMLTVTVESGGVISISSLSEGELSEVTYTTTTA